MSTFATNIEIQYVKNYGQLSYQKSGKKIEIKQCILATMPINETTNINAILALRNSKFYFFKSNPKYGMRDISYTIDPNNIKVPNFYQKSVKQYEIETLIKRLVKETQKKAKSPKTETLNIPVKKKEKRNKKKDLLERSEFMLNQ